MYLITLSGVTLHTHCTAYQKSQAGDNAGVRTPSESSDADNIPYQYTQTLKAAAVAVVAVVAGGEETAVVVAVAATLVAVGRIYDDP